MKRSGALYHLSRRRRVSRAIPRRHLRYTFSRLSGGIYIYIYRQHLRGFFRDNSSCGHTICFKIAPNVVPGRVHKSRYRNYASGTSAWVQSATPRDDEHSKVSQTQKSDLGSAALL